MGTPHDSQHLLLNYWGPNSPSVVGLLSKGGHSWPGRCHVRPCSPSPRNGREGEVLGVCDSEADGISDTARPDSKSREGSMEA